MSKSSDNLQAAFAGESQANRKYLAFAKKADQEGFPQIARLFRAAAAAETVHAQAHFRAMDGVKDIASNLDAAIAGENYEFVAHVPAHAGRGRKRRATNAPVPSFKYALAVEQVHEALYRDAAEALAQGKDLPEVEYYVCPVCGNTHAGPMVGRCPVCNTPGEKYEKIG